MADFESVAPLTNVLTAEQRHSTAIAVLSINRGLTAPVNPWEQPRSFAARPPARIPEMRTLGPAYNPRPWDP